MPRGTSRQARLARVRSAVPRQTKQSSTLAEVIFGGVAREDGTPRNYRSLARETAVRNIIGHRAIKWVAENVAALPITWLQGETELDERHPFLQLLERPNLLQTYEEFVETILAHLLLSGKFVVRADGILQNNPPLELWPQRPDCMRTKFQPGNPVPVRYIVEDVDTGRNHNYEVDQLTGRSNLIVLRRPHPLEPVAGEGLSDVEPAAWAVDILNAGSAWNYSLLRRGARPLGGFSTDEELTDEGFNRLREQIDELYGGADNAGRPLLAEGGLQWMDIGKSPSDMDWIKGHETSARDVAISLGVPPQVLGIPGSQTFANYKEARMAGYEDTIIPLGERVISAWVRWLAPAFGENIRGMVDRDSVEALAPKREARWKMVSKTEELTINERREKLGFPGDQPGGDTVLVRPNQVPLWMLEELAQGTGGKPAETDDEDDTSAALADALSQVQAGGDPDAAVEALAEALGLDTSVARDLLAEQGVETREQPRLIAIKGSSQGG